MGIEAARNTWILALDADERVTPQLRAELGQVVAGRNPTHAAYRMKFRNHYLGRELRHGPPVGSGLARTPVHERSAGMSATGFTSTSSRLATSERSLDRSSTIRIATSPITSPKS